MRIAVASGKGGTGKTLVSTNLAQILVQSGRRVTYVDCDVEAPNGHLYLHPRWSSERRFSVPIPALRGATCSGCGACQEACAFNAIIALPDQVMLFPELCHGCGGCLLACDEDVLVEVEREIGTLRCGDGDGVNFRDGVLDVGEAKAPPLIEGLLRDAAPDGGQDGVCVIIDAPPGTSCSAVAVARGADRVLLVTEPTPFGLHDLKLAVGMCRAVGRPVGVVINRCDIGDHETASWLRRESIPIFAEIPYLPEVAAAYASGELAAMSVPSFRQALVPLEQALSGWQP
jgi:MinD superfamily P-loop ATPase